MAARPAQNSICRERFAHGAPARRGEDAYFALPERNKKCGKQIDMLADTEHPAPERILIALNSMCASEALRKSKRMRELLRYLVQESIERPGDPITAEAIAANVFNRTSGFDAIDDPIVRTTASRLRSALAAHYEQEGCEDEVEIRIPRGGYMPEFLPRVAKPAPSRPWEKLRSNLWILNVASTFVALAALGVALTQGAITCSP